MTNEVEVLEKTIDAIDFAIEATNSQDDYGMGMRNGMSYVKYLIDGKEPQYESKLTGKDVDEVGLVCDIFDKMSRDDQIRVWQYVNEIMEGE